MTLAYLALLGRIILVGYERILVKQLGQQSNSEGAAFLFFGVATLFLVPFLLFVSAPSSYGFLLLVALGSFTYAIAFALYVKSLSIGEASLVSPLYNFNVLFLLILTAILLGEPITVFKIAGILLLIFGASLLNRQRNLLRARVRARHVGNAVVFFASNSTPTTGATLPVDGGLPEAFPR